MLEPDDDHDEELDEDAWTEWADDEHDETDLPDGLEVTVDDDEDDEPDEEEGDVEPDEDEAPPALETPVASYPEPPCTLVVAQGDCLLSLATRYRMSEDKIWNAGPNAALRAKRTERNQLAPGDELFIPAREEAVFAVQLDRRHRFKTPLRSDCEIVVRLLCEGQPRAGIDYTILLDGESREGTTDGAGRVRERIPKRLRTGWLVLHLEDEPEQRFELRFGQLDPIETATGAQARLNHLGYMAGLVDGWLGPKTASALRLFQDAQDLEPTGELDDATRAALKEAHGS